MVLAALVSFVFLFSVQHAPAAPFTGVRFEGDVAHVEVGATFHRLHAIDGVATSDIVAFCQRTWPDKWQKRFGEDLVEVLTSMGHAPGAEVTLRLEVDGETVERRARMTTDNRRAVREANARAAAPREPVRRVEREHAQHVRDARLHYLARPVVLDAEAHSGRLSRSQAEQDLDQLEWLVERRFSYRDRVGLDYRAAFDAARLGLVEKIARDDFTLLVAKLLGLFGDGHSRVDADPARFLPGGFLPYLLAESEHGVVAFQPDRSGTVDRLRPYVKLVDGLPVEKWLEAASRLAPEGSPQLVRDQALANSRYVNWVRLELGREPSAFIEVLLVDEKSSRTFLFETKTSGEKPLYGEWPRTRSRELDGIGYLRIPSMADDDATLAELHATMRSFAETKGLVIDVRGNGGGSRRILRELFGYFMRPDDPPRVANVAAYRLREGEDPDAPEGYLADRELFPAAASVWNDAERAAIEAAAASFRPQWAPPQGEFSAWHYFVLSRDPKLHAFHYSQPVVVLLDEGCFSATDVFLGAFAGWRDVKLVGTPSGGGSGRSLEYRLEHAGLSVRLSSMVSFRPDGRLYDGEGVHPDVGVLRAPDDFVEREKDTALDTALALLRGS